MRALPVAVLVLGLSPATALACGTIQMWTDSYWRPDASDRNRQTALAQMTVVCGTKTDAAADRRLLAVLIDADRRGYDPSLLRRVLETHRCLPSVARADGPDKLIALTGARCP
jgi:hypothetical protein